MSTGFTGVYFAASLLTVLMVFIVPRFLGIPANHIFGTPGTPRTQMGILAVLITGLVLFLLALLANVEDTFGISPVTFLSVFLLVCAWVRLLYLLAFCRGQNGSSSE